MISSQVVRLLMAVGYQLERCLLENVIPGVSICVYLSVCYVLCCYSDCVGEEETDCTQLECGGKLIVIGELSDVSHNVV